jgi:hypothetical protein
MAPEMLDPNFRENLSFRADLYAAGVTAFEFATGGTHPLARTADDMVRTITRILHQEPRRLLNERPDLPVPLTNRRAAQAAPLQKYARLDVTVNGVLPAPKCLNGLHQTREQALDACRICE